MTFLMHNTIYVSNTTPSVIIILTLCTQVPAPAHPKQIEHTTDNDPSPTRARACAANHVRIVCHEWTQLTRPHHDDA